MICPYLPAGQRLDSSSLISLLDLAAYNHLGLELLAQAFFLITASTPPQAPSAPVPAATWLQMGWLQVCTGLLPRATEPGLLAKPGLPASHPA